MINKQFSVPTQTVDIPDGMDGVIDVDGIIFRKLTGLQHDVDEALASFIMSSIMGNANAYKARHMEWPKNCYLTREQHTLLKKTRTGSRDLQYEEGSSVVKIHGMYLKLIPQTKKPLEVD